MFMFCCAATGFGAIITGVGYIIGPATAWKPIGIGYIMGIPEPEVGIACADWGIRLQLG